MKSNRSKNSPINNGAGVKRCERLVFTICCILGIAVALCPYTVYSQTQENDSEKIVFFSIPIGVDSAPIYASPTKNSYQTGSILKDQYVEVYFCNKDGFCAIRPPQGSFSWINGKFIELEGNNTGKIVSTSGKVVPVRVGSDSPITSSVVQIGLKNDQKVKLIDKVELPDSSTWYKIMPPSGEFRWIELSSLFQDEALSKLPSKLTTSSEFENKLQTQGLIQASALENVASDLAESEELVLPPAIPFQNSESPIGYDPTSSNDQEQLPSKLENANNATVDLQSFAREMERLKTDVSNTLQKSTFSVEENKILQLRVEELFDAAPSDSDRYVLQSLYDSLKKAEKARIPQQHTQPQPLRIQQLGNQVPRPITPAIPSEIANKAPNDATISPYRQTVPNWNAQGQFQEPNLAVYPNGPNYLTQGNAPNFNSNFNRQGTRALGVTPGVNGIQWVQAFDEQGRMQMLPVDRNGNVVSNLMQTGVAGSSILNAPSSQNIGVLPQGYASASKDSGLSNKSKNKKTFAFAFSKENSPFRAKNKSAQISDGTSDSNLSRLPPLLPTAQVIVPPQDYDMGIAANQVRQNSKLASRENSVLPNAKSFSTQDSGTNTALAKEDTTPKRVPQGILAFQEPKFTDGASNTTPEGNAVKINDGRIIPASSNQPKPNGLPSSKIRQTGGFTPVTVRTKDGFDAKGALVAVSPVGDGAPRFALLDSTGGEFNVYAYLQPGKGVVLERFVGSQVGVKGNIGTISVNGKTYKFVVVTSIFPQ